MRLLARLVSSLHRINRPCSITSSTRSHPRRNVRFPKAGTLRLRGVSKALTSSISFHPAALAEVEDAEAWYAAEREELGDAFVADLEATVVRVASFPKAFPERWAGVRQAPLRRFPYVLVFRLVGDRVQVIAVAHGHRKPRYWAGR